MKKFLGVFLALLCLATCIPAGAYQVLNCTYWYSDASFICNWASTPTICKIKLNTNDGFIFDSAFTHARNAWSNAGVSSSWISYTSSAKIICYGGTRTEIYTYTNVLLPTSYNGYTDPGTMTLNCYLDYNGSQKSLYYLSKAKVYIVDKDRTATAYVNTFMHEMGHSLGWAGHSSLNTDVMYSYETSVLVLTNRDKHHLNQVFS